jgi:hypothetical protein
VVVETVLRYSQDHSLGEGDWEHWVTTVTEEIAEPFGLLLSERKVGNQLASSLEQIEENVWAQKREQGLYLPSGLFVLLELRGQLSDETVEERLGVARNALEGAIDKQEPALIRLP